jgi:hypothetical protein
MRSQLINDVFSLSQANKVSSIKPFELVKFLPKENEYLPWNTFINRVSFYIDMLESTEIYGDFENYLLDLVQPIYKKLTWINQENDSWLTRYDFFLFHRVFV